jgi:hypothetical protein
VSGPVDVEGPRRPDLRPTTTQLEDESATADGIYGIIVGSAVMASVHVETALRIAVATVVTLLVYWTAEKYAHIMARRIVHGPRLSWVELRHELAHGWRLVTASFTPLAALVGTRLLGASVANAVLVALVTATVLLSAAGWRVGRQADLSAAGRLLSAACAGALGVVMILLKALAH